MESSKPIYEVEIAGLPLKLRSSHDSATVQELVTIVNRKVNEALGRSQKSSFQNALLLAALHLAEELVLLKRAARTELGDIEDEALQILNELKLSPQTTPALDV
jgi:cell division protein ZapA